MEMRVWEAQAKASRCPGQRLPCLCVCTDPCSAPSCQPSPQLALLSGPAPGALFSIGLPSLPGVLSCPLPARPSSPLHRVPDPRRQLCTGESGAVPDEPGREGSGRPRHLKGAFFYRIIDQFIDQAGVETESVFGGQVRPAATLLLPLLRVGRVAAAQLQPQLPILPCGA